MLLLFSLHSDLVSRAMYKRLSVDLVSPVCCLLTIALRGTVGAEPLHTAYGFFQARAKRSAVICASDDIYSQALQENTLNSSAFC